MLSRQTLGLIGGIFGRRRGRASRRNLDQAERSFRNIWSHLEHTRTAGYPLGRKRHNLLVLQMGKVASTSISDALNKRGINAFHCHNLSPLSLQHRLAHVLESDLTARLASHELRLHIRNVSLQMMVRWYQEHKQRNGQKLKVITLTRDPVARYRSSLVQNRHGTLPKIISWQRARLAAPADTPIDPAQSIRDFVLELASIIVAAPPSMGAEAYQACMALARNRWPQHPVVASHLGHWLKPFVWFHNQIESTFGLDVLSSPELRERGWAELQNDWVEILALRFESLAALVPEIQRFAGLTELTLPDKNVTEGKSGALELLAAMQAALDTPVGQACKRKLRASLYGRACGYDLLEQP